MPIAVVSRRGAARVASRHPWIYRSDIAQSDAGPGDLVRVINERERPLGWALWSSQSQIALRMVSDDTRATPPDERTMMAGRLRAAAAYRGALDIDATAYRLVHGEADGLPATIVDSYREDDRTYFVVQTLSQGADRRRDLLVELLVDLFAPTGILARNDPKVRRLEGLPEEIAVLHGVVPEEIAVREGRVVSRVDLRRGQKTGAFLDQRENHLAAMHYARGRALDAFTYHGGFALALASRADQVLAVDSSASAVEATRANADANSIRNVEVREANVFDELRELEIAGAMFDTIVLDPPAFAKNRTSVQRALAGYKEINLRAMRLLAPGGVLVTCSCSYNVDEALFLDVVEDAARDARRTMVLVERRMQARDHPVLLNVPETHYLKCFILRRADG